jgi:hypothetical protein
LGKYWIEFTDKDHTPFCTCRPWEFLAARSIDRRANAGISVVENDLPVDPAYTAGLKAAGAVLHGTSRWLNAATVIADSATASGLSRLPFVKKVVYMGRHYKPKNPPNRPMKKRVPLATYPKDSGGKKSEALGYAGLQNSLLNMPLLYFAGVRGKDIAVVVMDGGFTNADTIPMFDSIALAGRMIPGWDFVERDQGVFEGAQHGTSVLSSMAANMPGYLVGTAPDATYFLVKTEDTGGEFPAEEANWISGAEWADSIGARVINASLGYTVFNDTTLSHRFSQLDGHTAIGSRGATIAATKGMIICNSAGNSGTDAWHYVGVPADAPGIIAVGATDSKMEKADFSSFGPTADGRIKPDLCAPGEQVVVAGNTGIQLGLSSGTSLASPMLAGAIASLWSAFPDKIAAEIADAVFASADQADHPDNQRGYGQPDMGKAWLSLGGYWSDGHPNDNHREGVFSYSRRNGEMSMLLFEPLLKEPVQVELRNFMGQKFNPAAWVFHDQRVATLTLSGLEKLPPGAWQVVVYMQNKVERFLGQVCK